MLCDLRRCFAGSDRDGPLLPGCNCTAIFAHRARGRRRSGMPGARLWPNVSTLGMQPGHGFPLLTA
jgi:hypothetical protein